MKGSVLTNRVTGILTFGLEALVAEMLISPEHVPAVKPDGFICTLSVLGVAPLL